MIEDFVPFVKIGRLSRDMLITEKLDGSNGVIAVGEDGSFRVGSRNQWLDNSDNFGFALWAHKNRDELIARLGPGRHYGEWWGAGIQRRYGLSEKRFSLFNVNRWGDSEKRPACCGVVPTLYVGPFDTGKVAEVMAALLVTGSQAAPGFMKPEGVVIFHTQSGALFKKTYDKDDAGKGKEPPRDMP